MKTINNVLNVIALVAFTLGGLFAALTISLLVVFIRGIVVNVRESIQVTKE